MLWLLSSLRLSSSMYSASAASGLSLDRYASISLRTFDSKFARSRVWAICDFKRDSSVRCCCSISLCLARFVDFSADGVGSESRTRAS